MNQNQVDLQAPNGVESDQRLAMNALKFTPGAYSAPASFPAILALGGGENKVKPTQFTEGIVTITEGRTPTMGRPYFELRYVDPDSGRDVKRRVKGNDPTEARKIAKNMTRRAFEGKGYLAKQIKAPGLEDGLLEAIRLSRARDYVKDDMILKAKTFLHFMAEHYPAALTWGDLRPSMVETYVRECERPTEERPEGLAYDSIRNRLKPIMSAWRRMYADYPELVKAPPSIKLTAPPPREIVCLEAGEVAALIDWLKAHAPDVWPMACLQGLAGLRMFEAAALRAQDVDVDKKTITVTDTGRHKPKTRDSYRTIPVCDEVVEALKVALADQKVRPTTGELFTNKKGNLWVKDAMTLRWGRLLKHAAAKPKKIKRKGTGKSLTLNPHGLTMPRLGQIPARKLRAAFATLASKAGAPDRLLKAYLGHSSGDMLGGHYRRIDLDELRLVSDLMNGWRVMAQGSGARKDSGKILSLQVAEG